eukprot:CAMPEP_0114988680 /NCGR_PEP_ID=MMETSP0216-20121206/9744_1 /TAXON_ID=223996 /ORGANISM="Protocruzia adherens, Strain Boccale" /LENGTH=41 /DNA_ID= /DNA_START= /DNA_END= /DNA_ORIENTATION=
MNSNIYINSVGIEDFCDFNPVNCGHMVVQNHQLIRAGQIGG